MLNRPAPLPALLACPNASPPRPRRRTLGRFLERRLCCRTKTDSGFLFVMTHWPPRESAPPCGAATHAGFQPCYMLIASTRTATSGVGFTARHPPPHPDRELARQNYVTTAVIRPFKYHRCTCSIFSSSFGGAPGFPHVSVVTRPADPLFKSVFFTKWSSRHLYSKNQDYKCRKTLI